MSFHDYDGEIVSVNGENRMGKVSKNFVSPLEKFLEDVDKKYPKKSNSQLADIKKHDRIFRLRDAGDGPKKETLWEGF